MLFFECFDEITQIIESGGVGNFCDRQIRCDQLVTGAFNTIVIEVINRCPMRHLVKKAAEIFGRHIYTSRNFFQCKRKIIGRFHKFQCLLQLQNPFVASVFLIRCVFTETFTEESAEKLIHGAENYKLIPLFFGGCRIKSVQSVRWIVLQIFG